MRKSFVLHVSKRWLIVLLALLTLMVAVCFATEPVLRRIYPMRYAETVATMAERYAISPSLIYAIIFTESKFDRFALSSADARGLMQITGETYQWVCQRMGEEFLEIDSLYDPYVNIQCGVALIHLLQEKFDNTETVLAAYNAGQGRVNEWLQNPDYSLDGKTLTQIPYDETANYVHRVIHTQEMYQKLYNIF